ncbi:MAG: energy transducer TonB [Novosphingobium sp.]|nr:energy transducer TonB [Novosphingobium sp.]
MTVHAQVPLEDRVSFPGGDAWTAGGGFRSSRGNNAVSLALAILLTGGMVSTLLALNIVGSKHVETRVTTVTLEDKLEDQPKKPEEPAKPEQASLVTPQIAPPQPIAEIPAPPIVLSEAPVARPAVEHPEIALSPPAPPAAPKAGPPLEASDLSGNLISAKPPSYPAECRRNREQGTVVLAVVVAPDGTVQEISVSRSSGFDRLDKAALNAVRKWRWTPFKRDGNPVSVRGLVPIPFVLRG